MVQIDDNTYAGRADVAVWSHHGVDEAVNREIDSHARIVES